jgi:hypothetical protein
MVFLCYVIGSCEGAPFDHVFRVSAWSRAVSRVYGRTRLCNFGDWYVSCRVYICVGAGSGVWCVSGSFVVGWS